MQATLNRLLPLHHCARSKDGGPALQRAWRHAYRMPWIKQWIQKQYISQMEMTAQWTMRGGSHSLAAAVRRATAMRRMTLGQTGTARSLMMRAVYWTLCQTAKYQLQL